MQIIELEQKTGLDRATIRYYEKEGMISPERHENGYRDYTNEDLQQLLKIKLLRQLDMPLSKIRGLQQGSTDFQSALEEQMQLLAAKRDQAQRSSQICKMMKSDCVTYSGLNANYYLEQWNKIPLEYPATSQPATKVSGKFYEYIPKEHHSLRHYFARNLDIAFFIALVMFVQVVFFRTRYDTLVLGSILAMILWIPLEALCYVLFATTPGKFAFGIRVDHISGTKHNFASAIRRSFGAYRFGMGWGIPFWHIWRLFKSYKIYKNDEQELPWDGESEITYHQFIFFRDLLKPIGVFIALIAMIVTTSVLLNTPKYSGENLKLEQFAANYNDYYAATGTKDFRTMDAKGKLSMPENNSSGVVVIVSGRLDENYPQLEYIMEGEAVRGFTCKDTITYKNMVSLFNREYAVAIKALLAAQPGEDSKSADRFLESLLKELTKVQHTADGKIVFENDKIRVQWSAKFDEGCKFMLMGDSLMITRLDQEAGLLETSIRVELK